MSKIEDRVKRITTELSTTAKMGGHNIDALVRAIVREVFAEEAAQEELAKIPQKSAKKRKA